jgi:hypothetical protein
MNTKTTLTGATDPGGLRWTFIHFMRGQTFPTRFLVWTLVCFVLVGAAGRAHGDAIIFSIEKVTFEVPRSTILFAAAILGALLVGAFILFRRRR